MAKKKAPIVVTITKSRHKTQPCGVTINKPGSAEPYTLKERYTRPASARRGALRNLGLKRVWAGPVLGPAYNYEDANGRVVGIEFHYIDRTKSTKRDPLSKAFDASGSWRPTSGSTKKK